MENVVNKKSACLKIKKNLGEKAIILASKLEIVDRELEIRRDDAFIYVPLNRQPSEDELKALREKLPSCEISTKIFHERKKQIAFTELLEDKLPPHLLASLPRAIDFVGDIAIIEIPQELEAYRALVGEAILKTHESVQTVLAKTGAVSGTYRLREFSVIAGKPKTETIHKEYGCQFYVDLAKAYFSPRLCYEHNRVASMVKDGETVIDMFAGVGPFAILIAKKHENVKVYAIDVNPHAVEFLKKNIRLNRVEGKVHPILGDAKQVIEEKLLGMADRVIMNLPEKAIEFVDIACKAIKPKGGIIHFYTFVSGFDSLENMKLKLVEAVEKCGRKVEVLFSRFVRATAPYEWQAVIDAKIL
ncbi:MAG: class I SAM-dependent methyltransferase family protein [Candidatus Bathyarchaeota archaeon]|nr:class I SAM-dependent methyltransferase family protein [Candidatus Bathyarchaeota archaeon]MDI6805348.1 class I SAM-dependent methyltransferase family protein [Candidatus Bathyarchaeia archaeon]